MTPIEAASLAVAIKAFRPLLHVTVDDAPMPTVMVSAAPEGPVLVWAFGGCVYGPDPRPADKGFTFISGYECFDPYRPGVMFDPIAGPFADDDEPGIRVLAAMIQALPAREPENA